MTKRRPLEEDERKIMLKQQINLSKENEWLEYEKEVEKLYLDNMEFVKYKQKCDKEDEILDLKRKLENEINERIKSYYKYKIEEADLLMLKGFDIRTEKMVRESKKKLEQINQSKHENSFVLKTVIDQLRNGVKIKNKEGEKDE